MNNSGGTPQAIAQGSIFTEAERIISGDREGTYGTADDNLRTIAGIWNGLLVKFARDAGVTIPNDVISAEGVAIMMAGMKLARLAHNPQHRDSQVDTCGYIGLLRKIAK